MYRELLARKVLSFDELMKRREEGVELSSDYGYTLDLALLALQDAQSKLGTVLGLLREVQNDSGNWLAVPLRERIDAAVEES